MNQEQKVIRVKVGVLELAKQLGNVSAGLPGDGLQPRQVAEPAVVAGRRVRNLDPQEGLFVDEEGNS